MKPGRTFKDQNSRRKRLAKKNPEKAIKEHKIREKRRKARSRATL